MLSVGLPGKVLYRIIFERLKHEVDSVLRGFRQDRGCLDYIAALRIIVEQSIFIHTLF